VRLQTISKSSKTKNTFETRLGVLRRHKLKGRHPYCETHVLIEHMNDKRGDGAVELVPRVVGLSIPQPTNAMLWAIFTLAHFKPFGISTDLLTTDEDPIACQAAFSFCLRSLKVMKDWEAIHEFRERFSCTAGSS